MALDNEDELLRSVAIQNAQSILLARQRAEQDLLSTREALRESAERLQFALAAGRLGDWSWDARTDQVTLGASAAGIFGRPHAQPLPWAAVRQWLHEGDREAVRQALERAIRERGDYAIECRVIHPGGEQYWIAARGRARYAADGAVQGMIGVVWDITERKRAEEALREETRVLEILNESGAAIASHLDLQTLVQTVTDAGTKLSNARFGAFFYNVTNRQGESYLLYSLSGAPREAFAKFGLPRNTPVFGPTFRGEGVMRSADITQDPRYGTMAPHHGMPKGHLPVRSYLAAPVISRSGEVIGGLFFGHPEPGVFTERSERLIAGIAAQAAVAIDNARLYEVAQRAAEERKVLLESEQSARAEAERMGAMKDEFLATLSHELRTPLGAILGWAQVLRRRALDEADLHQGLDVIERNARIQTQLIEDLLDMSRITSGKVRLDIQPLEPVSFIEAAVQTVRPAAEAKGIRLEKILAHDAGRVYGDPQRLQQVIWNLLSNAIKFTPKGGKVQVVLQRVDSHVEITVADTGLGIRTEFLELVFDRFRQVDASTTRRFGGLGLGLSIVKHLVELHGGTVAVTSPGEGLGATFTVCFPLTAVQGDQLIGPRGHPATPATMPAFNPSDLSGLRILVVDDQADARHLIKRILEECKAEVLVAASADEALRVLEKYKPDVLLSDIGMPGQDGYALLRRIRALETASAWKLPAIALTAFARSEDRTRALRAGFLVHVSKPVEPSELVATVASVAGRTG